MNIKWKQFLWLFGITGVILLASNVYAQPQGERFFGQEARREKREAWRLEVHKQLDLSPEQEKQLEAHRNKHRKTIEQLHDSIRAKREELRKELQKPELDMAKINQLHSELKAISGEMEDCRLEGILEVRKILTPEQLEKFTELMEKHRSGMKRWPERPEPIED